MFLFVFVREAPSIRHIERDQQVVPAKVFLAQFTLEGKTICADERQVVRAGGRPLERTVLKRFAGPHGTGSPAPKLAARSCSSIRRSGTIHFTRPMATPS